MNFELVAGGTVKNVVLFRLTPPKKKKMRRVEFGKVKYFVTAYSLKEYMLTVLRICAAH